MLEGGDAGSETRVFCSAAVAIDRHRRDAIGVNTECAPIAGAAQTKRARCDATRLSRSAAIEPPEQILNPRSFSLAVLAATATPDLLEHPTIEAHDVVVVVQDEFRRALGLHERRRSIFAGNEPSAVEGAQLREML